MRVRDVLFLGLACLIAPLAEGSDYDKLYPGNEDSAQALRYSVSFIEGGFQRGEVGPALKRFSAHYAENGTEIPLSGIKEKVSEIIQLRDRNAEPQYRHKGIYFEIESLEVSGDYGEVELRILVYSPRENTNFEKVRSRLDFEKHGGAWVLESSDGFLEKICKAFKDLPQESKSSKARQNASSRGGVK